MMPDIEPEIIGVADLSVQSLDFVNDNWSDPEIDWKLLAAAASDTGVATTRYGEYRLSYTKPCRPARPPPMPLHIDMCLPAGTRAVAPFAGTILMRGTIWSSYRRISASISMGWDCPLQAGDQVAEGDALGVIAGETGAIGGLRLQLCRDPDLVPPLFARPEHAHAWSIICPLPPRSSAWISRRRNPKRRSFSSGDVGPCRVQKHYYADPPQMSEAGRNISSTSRAAPIWTWSTT